MAARLAVLAGVLVGLLIAIGIVLLVGRLERAAARDDCVPVSRCLPAEEVGR